MLMRALLYCLFVLQLNANEVFITKRGETITLEQCQSYEVSADDQNQVKDIFVESFSKCYRLSNAHFNLSDFDLQQYLASDFEKIIRPSLYKQPSKVFLGAKKGDRLVGYALFENISNDTVYVAELSIASDFWRQGLGQKMTLYYPENNPLIKRIVLLTEKINLQAQKFYESIGFEHSDYTHEGYSPDLFCAYEKRIRP